MPASPKPGSRTSIDSTGSAGGQHIPSGQGGRIAFDSSQLPKWFHGKLSFEDAEGKLLRAAKGVGSFLVTENYPDTVYTLVFVDLDGVVRQATVTRSERKDGSMGTHFIVEDVRLKDCKDVPMVITHLAKDNGSELPRIDLKKFIPH